VGRLAGRQILADTVRILVGVPVAVHIDTVVVGHMVAAGKASYPLRARSTTCHLRKFTFCGAQ
jgi:hypothetical protein